MELSITQLHNCINILKEIRKIKIRMYTIRTLHTNKTRSSLTASSCFIIGLVFIIVGATVDAAWFLSCKIDFMN